jgi:hypothetical protein
LWYLEPVADEVSFNAFQWVVSGLLGLVTAVGSILLKSLTTRLETVESDLLRRNERISVLETHIDTVNRRLDRIEAKLDLLLEKKL